MASPDGGRRSSAATPTAGSLTHTGHPEWKDTRIVFELEPHEASGGLLRFTHVGLIARLSCYEICQTGWERFLASLLDYAEHGKGSPFS
jgi:hypothetical protein